MLLRIIFHCGLPSLLYSSYIGNHLTKWFCDSGWTVEQLDVLNEDWHSYDYSSYYAIVHVAGIVHRPKCKDWNLYNSVNCNMPILIATMAKKQGVKMFLFFSTMGVYSARKNLKGCVIDSSTTLLMEGNSMYGKSKLMAEIGLQKLQDDSFDVAFVRPPSVYGKDCKGGYISSIKYVALRVPIIPRAFETAIQSFIYIDNLCECCRIIIENRLCGVFCPQDDEIPNANRLLQVICEGCGKNYYESKLLGYFIRLVSFIPFVQKAYGGISYSTELSEICGHNYIVVPFENGMKKTVS